VPVDARYRPAPRFPTLGEGFFDPVKAASFPELRLRFRNQPWAARIGLGSLDDAEWEASMARFQPLPGNLEVPLALRYHGYQFRSYNPDLGDGRGFLYAQLLDPEDGRLLDLGTKGSGRTPWSRGGDGRLTLKGAVREILATELLEAHGVPTSKTLSVFETGESLERSDEPSPTRAAVLVRLSHGHVRFGSFERHAFHQDRARLGALLEWSVAQYYPELVDAPDLPVAFLREVVGRMAELAASWMAAGFVHGVLNTDNMNVTGESFDYGPWRFLPRYEPGFTAAYFDYGGLYAYGRQPTAVQWNLARLAEALTPLAPEADWEPIVGAYEPAFDDALRRRILARLGVASLGPDEDSVLLGALFGFMQESGVGFAQLFHDWHGGEASRARAAASPEAARYEGPRFTAFLAALSAHPPTHPGRLGTSYFQRPRPVDMVRAEVEEIWERIADEDDWGPLHWKVADIRAMGEVLREPCPSDPKT